MPRNDLIPWKSLILDPAFPVFKDRIQSIFTTTETSGQCPGAELGCSSHVAWLDWLRFEEFFSTSRRGRAPIHERLRSNWTASVFLAFLSTATSDSQTLGGHGRAHHVSSAHAHCHACAIKTRGGRSCSAAKLWSPFGCALIQAQLSADAKRTGGTSVH